MRSLVEELARGVVGRDDVFAAVQAAAAAGKGRAVLVVGNAGSGKTATLAALAARDPSTVVHLVGPELGRDDPRLVARALASQLGATSVPEEQGAAIDALHAALRAIGDAGERAIVVVDAIDRLRGATDGAALELLPSVVPPGVLFVLSARPGKVADAITHLPGVGRLVLAPLKDDARLAIARAVAPDRGDEQLQIAANACDGHPLFLRAILLASDAADAPPPTAEIAFGRLLTRLARAASLDASRALGLLATSRSGLTREDLAALLASPPATIASFISAAGPWLRERDGRVMITDVRVREWALTQVAGAAAHAALHSAIADRLAAGAASKRADALLDLTMHLEAAGRGNEIADLVDGGTFARIKATASSAEAIRDDLVRAVRATPSDVVRAARFGLAAALLGGDPAVARSVRAKTLVAAARGLPKKDGWELAERASLEAFTETDPARRDGFVVAAVAALRVIDAAEARRVAGGQPRGAARVRALVAAGDLASALAEAGEAPDAEREEALAEVLEPMAATDAAEVTKLLPQLHDAARRDRVLVALVAATKGIFLAGKISDAAKRVTALARIGEWDEAELAAEEVGVGTARAAAHERIAAAARAVNEELRATTHEAHAKTARAAIESAAERAASLREAAEIALDANPTRARELVDEAIDLDAAHASTRAALVLRARAAIRRPSGADLHEAIATLAPLGDALAELYSEIVGAFASALGTRYPEAARAGVDGVDWAEHFVASLGGRGPKTMPPPPLTPAIARAVSTLPWNVAAAPDPELAAIEQRVRDDAATPQEVDRLVDARVSSGDRTGAVGALLGWATRLRARGDRIDAAAAEERARAIDPGDPRHPPASLRPPPERHEPATAEVAQIDDGWGGEDEPRTVREDVPRGEAPWSKVQSPMAMSLGSAPTVSARTATVMGIAAVSQTPLAEEPPAAPAPPRKILDRTLRSEGAPIEPVPIVSVSPAPPSEPPPEPEPEIEGEDVSDQTSIMGAAERKALQKATRTGDAAILKEAAEKIAADRDAEERALAKASEGHETARKLVAASVADSEAFERPTKPPPPGEDAATPAVPFNQPPADAPARAPSAAPRAHAPASASARSLAAASGRAAPMPKKSGPGLAIAIAVLVIVIVGVIAELYFTRR
jgi:hypothetical protein